MKIKNFVISAVVVLFLTVGPSILAGLIEVPEIFSVLTAIVRIVGIATIPVLSVLAIVLYKKQRKEEKEKKRAHARYKAKKEFSLLEAELDDFRRKNREKEVSDFFKTITSSSFLPTEKGQQPSSYPAATEFDSITECLSTWNDISRKKRAPKV